MKILVTGGAGYIGSIVATELIKLSHEVVILDNLSTGHKFAVPESARFIEGDVQNANTVNRALDGIDAVIHFAAKSLVGESVQHPDLYWQTNLDGTKNLLEQMRIVGVKKIVFSSTAAVYGDPVETPITEDSPTQPKSPYGESKLAVDELLSKYCQKHGFAAFSLRYFNVAGAVGNLGELHNPETHLIPRALASVLNNENTFEIYGDDWPTPDGTSIRDYIHISDLADAHIKALQKLDYGKHWICNLGTENGASVLEVIDAIERVTGKKVVRNVVGRRSGDPAVLITSNKTARELLDWTPKKTLTEIVADTYNFMKART